ncbi:MAG: hypothetical protein CMP78_06365 [Formosa sp.]|nr:hypothetical protein [Formosa sp.]|tara:strand:+ start:1352 stop:1534 length:183 start_codon:yes stop_codon:yes gene_type:complete
MDIIQKLIISKLHKNSIGFIIRGIVLGYQAAKWGGKFSFNSTLVYELNKKNTSIEVFIIL